MTPLSNILDGLLKGRLSRWERRFVQSLRNALHSDPDQRPSFKQEQVLERIIDKNLGAFARQSRRPG